MASGGHFATLNWSVSKTNQPNLPLNTKYIFLYLLLCDDRGGDAHFDFFMFAFRILGGAAHLHLP